MTEVVACVPTIGLSPYLDDLVHELDRQDVLTRLYVNSEFISESILQLVEGWPLPDGPDLMHVSDQSIYVSWNQAAAWARELNAYLFCVTDDVVVSGRLVGELAAALDCRPDYGLISTDIGHTHETFSPVDVTAVSHQAGSRYQFATWCFMARPEAWQDVDSRYQIWYGDDDLIWKVNQAGWLTGYLRGVGSTHHTSTTSRQLSWIHQAAHEDGILWANTGH